MQTVYVNGEFLPASAAKVSVFDRGFLFADAVYEVVSVLDGALIDLAGHLRRLRSSLAAIDIDVTLDDHDWRRLLAELRQRNRLREGVIYLQVTRGAAERDFLFPESATPSIVAFTQHRDLLHNPLLARGLRVVTLPDLRWARCDIKTVSLLAASMAKQQARRTGADDAWLVRDATITEGTSSNAFVVTDDGVLVTRQLGSEGTARRDPARRADAGRGARYAGRDPADCLCRAGSGA